MFKMSSRFGSWLAVIILILLGWKIVLHCLSCDSFWIDEILTIRSAHGLHDSPDHPPLYFNIISTIITLLGENEFSLRLTTAVSSVLVIPILFLFGQKTGNIKSGLWAAFFLILSPFYLTHAQDARPYALLLLFSTASYLFLYLATTKCKLHFWLGFSIITALNLYTHYSAFIVLASQCIYIGIWLILNLRHKQLKQYLIYPIISGFFIILLYLPGLAQLFTAVTRNVGANSELSNAGITSPSISLWIEVGFDAISPSNTLIAYLFVLLSFLGIAWWGHKKNWSLLLLITTGLILPYILITISEISRITLARYIIFILPLYLLAVGTGLDTFLNWITKYLKRKSTYYVFASIAIILFIIMSQNSLQQVYQNGLRNWRGAINYAIKNAETDSIFISLSTSDHNHGRIPVPYYLNRNLTQYTFMGSNTQNSTFNGLTFQEALTLSKTNQDVWFIILGEFKLDNTKNNTDVLTEKFQGQITVAHIEPSSASAAKRLIEMYEQIIPSAHEKKPKCELQQDLAMLYYAEEDYLKAEEHYLAAVKLCPDIGHPQLINLIFSHTLPQHISNNTLEKAIPTALKVFELDKKNEQAIQTITAIDLWQMTLENNKSVQTSHPIEFQEFIMPHNGDRGDVLLIHPPEQITYTVTLPKESVALYFRAALAPESWEWGGDGAEIVVTITDENGVKTEILRDLIGNELSERDWHDYLIPLTNYRTQTISITLESAPGPNINFDGDWLGWETPRIIWHPQEKEN